MQNQSGKTITTIREKLWEELILSTLKNVPFDSVLYIGQTHEPNHLILKMIENRCGKNYNYLNAQDCLNAKSSSNYDMVMTINAYQSMFGMADLNTQAIIASKLAGLTSKYLFMLEVKWKNVTSFHYPLLINDIKRCRERLMKDTGFRPDPGSILEEGHAYWFYNNKRGRYENCLCRPEGNYMSELIEYCEEFIELALNRKMISLASEISKLILPFKNRIGSSTLTPIECNPPILIGILQEFNKF